MRRATRVLSAAFAALALALALPAAAQSPERPALQYQVDPFWPKPLPNRWEIG